MGKLWEREVSVGGEAVEEEVSVGGEAVGEGGECTWGNCWGGHCPEETVDLFALCKAPVGTLLTCKACCHSTGMRTS